MKLLFDFFPILVFFLAYKLFGIYVATAATMAASLLQVSGHWIKHRSFESLHLITLFTVMLFGGSTLLLHNETFIKWKPTVIYWAFAFTFLVTQLIRKKPLIETLLGSKMSLPKPIWKQLNLSWAIFFITMGFINLYVMYRFSTDVWVNFKLFGTLGLTLAFLIAQAICLAKHLDIKHPAVKKTLNIKNLKSTNDESFLK